MNVGEVELGLDVAEDRAWVKWHSGHTFHFPISMRTAVGKLCDDYLAGRPSTDGRTLLQSSNAPTVEKLFKVRIDGKLRPHPAWGTMIVSVAEPGAKGRYKIQDPGPQNSA